jgi:hypothetical protein
MKDTHRTRRRDLVRNFFRRLIEKSSTRSGNVINYPAPVSAGQETVAPATNGPTPATNGPTPATNGPTPATNGPTPATNGPTPATNGPTPATNGPTPATNGPTPATNVPTPATNVPAPASSAQHGGHHITSSASGSGIQTRATENEKLTAMEGKIKERGQNGALADPPDLLKLAENKKRKVGSSSGDDLRQISTQNRNWFDDRFYILLRNDNSFELVLYFHTGA